MVFNQDVILPINHVVDWRYIRHCKQTYINKESIREESTIINYDYRVGDKVMLKGEIYIKIQNTIQGPI